MANFISVTDERGREIDINVTTIAYLSPLGGDENRGTAICQNFTVGHEAAARIVKTQENYAAVKRLLPPKRLASFVELHLDSGVPVTVNADTVANLSPIGALDKPTTNVTFAFAVGDKMALRTLRIAEGVASVRGKLS